MHLLSSQQFAKNDIESILGLASELAASPQDHLHRMNWKILATIFYEPSTRTRLSFESAMIKLGGNVISAEDASGNSSAWKGESLADTLRTVSCYSDVIVVRHPEQHSVRNAVYASSVPVINAGDGANEHPTQALLDLFTMRRRLGRLDGLKILFTGDLAANRTVKSLLGLLRHYEVKVHLAGASHYTHGMPEGMWYQYHREDDLAVMLPQVDVVYMTRHQSERGGERRRSGFVMDVEKMKLLSPEAIVMHPMPRNEEISPLVDSDPRAAYFDQAADGVWVRMAVLMSMVKY